MPDGFSKTPMTWIDGQLARGQGGIREINEYVVKVYLDPLVDYYRSIDLWSSHNGNLCPDDVLQSFVAERVLQPGFWERWRASGSRLHRWLIDEFADEIREHVRGLTSLQRTETAGGTANTSTRPDTELQKIMLRSMVRQAVVLAVRVLREEGHSRHARLLVLCRIREITHASAARRLGLSSGQVKNGLRVAYPRLRVALRRVIERDGAAPEDLDKEISRIMRQMTGHRSGGSGGTP